MSYHSMEEILKRCEEQNLSFFEAVLLEDCNDRGVKREASMDTMRGMWRAMVESTNGMEET